MASFHVCTCSLCCSGDVLFWLRDRIVKFKTCQIQKYGILAKITKFNARQFFLLYDNSFPREDHALVLLMWVRCCSSTKMFKVPYSFKQTPRLLFISSHNFVRLLFESSNSGWKMIHCLKESGVAADTRESIRRDITMLATAMDTELNPFTDA